MKSATFLPLLVCLSLLISLFVPQIQAETANYKGKVVIIPVGEEDLIARARFEFMSRTLERCTDEGAEAVIFDLDTPGGLLWDTVDLMMNDLQKLKPRSFAFVNKRALSAGAMIAVATDGIYIAPAGTAGAASPVYGGGQEMGDAERAKMNSATMGMARAVAKRKGHDPRVIEAMIDMSRELKIGDVLLDSKDSILTLDAEQAVMKLENGKPLFAKGIVDTLDEIKKAEGLKGETVIAEPTGFEVIAIWVTKYAAILILIGVAGGYLEMQAPGFGIPGFVSIAAFSLFFFGHYVAGSLVGQETAAAAAVFIIGIALLIIEIAIFPGLLIPGILGFVMIMAALVYTMSGWEMPVSPTLPGSPAESPDGTGFDINIYATGLRNFALGVLGAGILILAIFRFLPQTGPFQRLVLDSSIDQGEAKAPNTATVSIGDLGQTISALRPYGTAQFGERRIEAMVESGYLQSGTEVRIRDIQGPKIIVEPIA
ncbi:membrane-bound serine protease (ClpP class) [Prosthecobacter fusiformis]|uniref:Membrane-bound serine protease (ClpP class) n=1 Tax=Prosthecobacter fusiformis TaxID=48464 RepID=A0A4R7RK33_9BACT|nr:NfeD family protein [Prosthecobacter fusiformis]TDU64056.1 membrane-bound serine protease (ClpP class) [Prosthecobacter fusiformis]